MKLSTRSRYGLRLMVELGVNYQAGSMQLSEISRRQDISEKYLGQIVISLKNAGLIQSVRGAQGGYYLSRDPSLITVFDIVEVMEGTIVPVECETENCGRMESCVTSRVWSLLYKSIKDTLTAIKLSELVKWYTEGASHLTFDI